MIWGVCCGDMRHDYFGASLHQALVLTLLFFSQAIILGNVFEPSQAMVPGFLQELCKDFEIQCARYGPIEKLDASWTETSSSLTIIFVSSLSAADCIAGMNNLTCDGRQLTAAYDPTYLVTDKEIEKARELSVTEKQRRQVCYALCCSTVANFGVFALRLPL